MMGIVKQEDVIGYMIGDLNKGFTKIVCVECLDDKEEQELTQENLLDERWAEEQEAYVFCDRCEQRIW